MEDAEYVEVSLLVQIVMCQDGCSVTDLKSLKLSDRINKLIGLVRGEASFATIMKSVLTFSAEFRREHGVSFIAAELAAIFGDMLSSYFLTSNCRQTYYVLHPGDKDIPETVQNFRCI